MGKINMEKLEVANKVLSLILSSQEVRASPFLSVRNNRLYLTFFGYATEKTIQVRHSPDSDYFIYRGLPYGGTHERAITLLCRWIRGEDCCDIRAWKQWTDPMIGMKPPEIVEILTEAGYPRSSKKGYWI